MCIFQIDANMEMIRYIIRILIGQIYTQILIIYPIYCENASRMMSVYVFSDCFPLKA